MHLLSLGLLISGLCLSACGGGGGGSSMPPGAPTATPPTTLAFPYHPWNDPVESTCGPGCTSSTITLVGAQLSVDDLPTLRTRDLPQAPIVHNYDGHQLLMVGVDHGNRPLEDLPIVGARNGLNVHYGQLNDGVTRQRVSDFLAASFRAGPVERMAGRPRVEIIGAQSADDVSAVVHTLQALNTALPEAFTFDSVQPNPSRSFRHTVDRGGYYNPDGSERDNTIYIEFMPIGTYYDGGNSGATSWANRDGSTVTSNYIQMNKEAIAYENKRFLRILLGHEILHALGFDHVGNIFDSILLSNEGIYNQYQGELHHPLSLLYPEDRAALLALYRDLQPGGDYRALGPWTGTATHLHGNGPYTGFGVILQNGFAEPWAYGPKPGGDLRDNSALSGTVTWTGGLLGFSNRQQPVAGDASLSVTMTTLRGTAAFTNLETWSGSPGDFDPGSGTRWGDGDLSYGIAVRGNTFTDTGGDAGTVTGIFTGPSHEGAAGVVERTDLTAAFGATR